MLNILLITHCFPADADDLAGNFLYDFCISLKQIRSDLQITVFTPRMNNLFDMQYLNKAVDTLHPFVWLGGKKRLAELKTSNPWDLLQLASIFYHGKKALKKLLQTNKFDFVLAPWVIPNGYYISALFAKYKIPYALWALGSDLNVYGKKPVLKNLVAAAYKNCALSYTNSKAMQLLIDGKYGRKSSLLFTNRRLPQPAAQYSTDKKFRLLFVGRLEKVKGPKLFLEAIAESGVKDFFIEFIGDGSMKNELENVVKMCNLQDNILFHGKQNGAFITERLKQTDYLVISSYFEGMPVVFWEAMQTATPVISTDVGDVKYYCDNYNVGRVCGVNSKELGELIWFLSEFRVLRQVLSANTQRLAELSDIKNSGEIFIRDIERFIKSNKLHNY